MYFHAPTVKLKSYITAAASTYRMESLYLINSKRNHFKISPGKEMRVIPVIPDCFVPF